jgi:hypothetical protein
MLMQVQMSNSSSRSQTGLSSARAKQEDLQQLTQLLLTRLRRTQRQLRRRRQQHRRRLMNQQQQQQRALTSQQRPAQLRVRWLQDRLDRRSCGSNWVACASGSSLCGQGVVTVRCIGASVWHNM